MISRPHPRSRGFLPSHISGRLLLLLVVVIVPVLLVEAGIYYRRFTVQWDRELQGNLEVARATGVAFDAYVRDILRVELAVGTTIASLRPPVDWTNQYFAANAATYASLREFTWLDPQGRAVASSNPEVIGVEAGDRPYFQAVARGEEWVVSDLLQARVGGEPVFTIVRGIRDQTGALQGVVVATVLPEKLGVVGIPIERGGGGTILVVDRQGFLVYRRPEVELFWEERRLPPQERLVAQALDGQEASGTFFSVIDNQERMGAFVPVRSIGWAVGATVPVSQVTGPTIQDILAEVGALLAIVGVAFVAALALGRTVTDPIDTLKERARALAHGDLARRAEVAGPSELKELAEAFNTMAEQIQRRTTQLEAANRELEAFAYSVSHDLRAPLRHVDGFSQALQEDYADALDEQGKEYLQFIREGTRNMAQLIDDLLKLSRVTRAEMRREPVDLSALAESIAADLRREQADRQAELAIAPGIIANGDPRLLRIVLENLLGNAWKFTAKRPLARIAFGVTRQDGRPVYYVRDNGAGFDMTYAGKLFGAFQRLHRADEFPGTGIGLATVQRIIHRHGGRVWAEGAVDKGATFFFTLE